MMSLAHAPTPAGTAASTPASAAATRYRAVTWQRLLMKSSVANIGILSILLGLGTVLASLVYGSDFNFYTAGNLAMLSQQIPIMGIVAIGAGFLMISGEFDLSVAGVYTLAPFVMAIALTQWQMAPALAIALGFGCAAVVGLVNGWVTVALRVPSFIATLGMMFFLRGVVRWVSMDATTGQPGPVPFNFGADFAQAVSGQSASGLFAQSWWLLGVMLVAALVLNRHRFGNHLFATGGDADAAEKTGIRTRAVKQVCFVICSLCAALAGLMQSTRIGVVSPASTLNGLELSSIAACVVGGVLLMGGRGNVLGMVLGAALLVVVENLLVLVRAPGEYSPAFIGCIVILSVIFNSNFGSASRKK